MVGSASLDLVTLGAGCGQGWEVAVPAAPLEFLEGKDRVFLLLCEHQEGRELYPRTTESGGAERPRETVSPEPPTMF